MQKQQHFNGIENILLKGCTTTGARNCDQNSPSRPDSGTALNSLRSGRFLACHVVEHACSGNVPSTATEWRACISMHYQHIDQFHVCIRLHPNTSVNGSQMKTSRRVVVHETFHLRPPTARLFGGIFQIVRNSMQRRYQTYQATSGSNFQHLRQLVTRKISTEIMLIRTFNELITKFNGTNPEMTQLSSTSSVKIGCFGDEPVATINSFSDLEYEEIKDQDKTDQVKTIEIPKPKPPNPIHLKIKDNFRTQLKLIYQNFTGITNKTSGEFVKLFTKDDDEHHNLRRFLQGNKDFEFFSVKPKTNKPIKVVIKGLPIFPRIQDIQSDLEEDGFTIEKVSQLISKKHKGPLPFFQITLPRNANNLKIFDIKTLGYMQIRREGFLVRGCCNCNNFYHTAESCHLKGRRTKCGPEHTTKQCPQENPFCINCKEYGHSACYTKCPKFPQPKKGSALLSNKTFNNNVCKQGVFFANVVSGVTPSPHQKMKM
ncbi:PRE_C2HC domain-containing protein [Trichonephila clavipes]|nr:PRE_C2HC domain-containing protein [Trichonephila clavipes]